MKIMKLVDENFLIRDYKLSKEQNITGSLLFNKEEDGLKSTVKSTVYHLCDPQKPTFAASQGTTSNAYPYMQSYERSMDHRIQHTSLAHCLLLTFEKCLNVHWLDYHKKLNA